MAKADALETLGENQKAVELVDTFDLRTMISHRIRWESSGTLA